MSNEASPPVDLLPNTVYTGTGKAGALYTRVLAAIADGTIDASKDGVVAQGVSRQTDCNGRKLLVTYSIKNRKLVEHFGNLGHDVSHDPQIEFDVIGQYSYQPFDEKGDISKTVDTDPMWTISAFVDLNAASTLHKQRYKGKRAGAEEFARVHYRHVKGWASHGIKQCLVIEEQHHITVILSAPPVSGAASAAAK